MNTYVKDVMSHKIFSIDCNETVRKACEIYRDSRVGCLIVTDNENIVGLVTERDIIVRTICMGRDPNTTKLEEGAWEEEIKFPVESLDPYYIPMGEDFERTEDETVNGIDCYVMIMRQDVQKSIESVFTPEDPNAVQYLEIPEGTGEVYVKIWLDKTDLHTVKSKSYLNITTETFSWLINGEVLIFNVS